MCDGVAAECSANKRTSVDLATSWLKFVASEVTLMKSILRLATELRAIEVKGKVCDACLPGRPPVVLALLFDASHKCLMLGP